MDASFLTSLKKLLVLAETETRPDVTRLVQNYKSAIEIHVVVSNSFIFIIKIFN